MTKDTGLFNASQDKEEKNAGPFVIRRKDQFPVEAIHAGDIGAIGKLTATRPATLLRQGPPGNLQTLVTTTQPVYFYAIEAASKNREESSPPLFVNYRTKDPGIVIDRNPETKQMTIGGQE